jgi:hypothetical protein
MRELDYIAKKRFLKTASKLVIDELEKRRGGDPLLAESVATYICATATRILERPCTGDDDAEHYALEDRLGVEVLKFMYSAIDNYMVELLG